MNKKNNNHLFKVFLTGHCKRQLKTPELIQYLKHEPGFVSARIPAPTYQGYAFVHFKDQQSSLNFIKKKKVRIAESLLVIKDFRRGRDLKTLRKKLVLRKLFLHNIPHTWDDKDLYDLFGTYGTVEEAFICKEEQTEINPRNSSQISSKPKYLRCIGFIVYSEISSANTVAELQELHYKGETIGVKPAREKHKASAMKKKAEAGQFPNPNQSPITNTNTNDILSNSDKINHLRSAFENGVKANCFDTFLENLKKSFGQDPNLFPFKQGFNNLKIGTEEKEAAAKSFMLAHRRKHTRIPKIQMDYHRSKPTKRRYYKLRLRLFGTHTSDYGFHFGNRTVDDIRMDPTQQFRQNQMFHKKAWKPMKAKKPLKLSKPTKAI